MDALRQDLTQFTKGITAIEAAYGADLKLVLTGGNVELNPTTPDYDKDQAELVIQLLRQGRKDIIYLTENPERTRQTLAKAQDALSEANTWVMVQLDLWDRLEKLYRLLFPDDARCIKGSDGCRPDAPVSCAVCEGKVRYDS